MTNIYLFITIACMGLLVWDYFRCRTKSVEDRYMALYGSRNWDACNMELCLSFDREKDGDVKALFQKRLSEHLDQIDIITAALILHELFQRHTDVNRLTVGLTVAFTFLDAKNQYGLITLKIKRSDFEAICRQMVNQINDPLRNWGTFSTQSYLLSFLPDWLFKKIMNYFRGQLDVLISSLPLGRKTAEINGVPIAMSCHPKELTIPYYFLLMGAGSNIHMSYTNKFGVEGDFMNQEKVIAAV